MRQAINAGPWLPDLPPLGNPGSPAMSNMVPLASGAYGPAKDLSKAVLPQVGGPQPLDSQVLGGGVFLTISDDVTHMFAATINHFYLLSPGMKQWVQVDDPNLTTGYFDALSAIQSGYDPTYRFIAFGNEIILTRGTVEALTPGGPVPAGFEIHTFDMTSANSGATNTVSMNFAPLMNTASDSTGKTVSASRGYYPSWAMVVKSFLVIGGMQNARQRVAWSGADAPSVWPAPGTNLAQQVQSDYEDLPGDLGNVQMGVSGLTNADAILMCDAGIWRMVYVGGSDIFDFYPTASGKGTQHPNSVVLVNGTVYYLSRDGFYAFDGLQSQPIGNQKVDRWFLMTAITSPNYTVRGVFDLASRCILWSFSTVSATRPNMLLVYNVDIGMWSSCTFSGEMLLQARNRSVQTFLVDVAVPADATFDVWAFDQSHSLALFEGPVLPASYTTREIEPGQQLGGRAWLRSATPLVDGWVGPDDDGEETGDPANDHSPADTITVAIATRQRMTDVPVAGPAVPLNGRGVCPLRGSFRYGRATVAIPGGSIWTSFQGVELEMQAAGLR